MKRPYLVNFLAIETDEYIAIRSSVSLSDVDNNKNTVLGTELKQARPFQSFGLVRSDEFRLKIVGLDSGKREIFKKSFESDSFGNFDFRIPISNNSGEKISKINVFETSFRPGMDLLVGSFIPTKISQDKKIVISDFDKTLADTRYSSPKEMYYSLSKPISFFPRIGASIDIIKEYIDQDYVPFILSASPHIYESAIRDWLYLQHIYTSNIFLKDYRKIFSLFEGDLTTKDLKTQGFYKLDTLIAILNMTGIPKELALMGDGFESDNIIYMTLCSILIGKEDPWMVWNKVKKLKAFKLTTKQNAKFLSKLYRLSSLVKNSSITPTISVHIRCREDNYDEVVNRPIKIEMLKKYAPLVNYYKG